MSELYELSRLLGHDFRDPQLLQQALTHPSVVREAGSHYQHNQRLEFLGDAVLQLVLTQELYLRFTELDEGALTKARAKMVNRRTLAEQARQLHLGPHLILSRGEEINGGRERPSALADTFEALVGAIFLDGGFAAAQRFVLAQFRPAFGEWVKVPPIENPKGELQEILQGEFSEPPTYLLVSASGPDHDRVFECVVRHQGVELGRGMGKSKKTAESQAALDALNRQHNRPDAKAETSLTPGPGREEAG